MKQSIIRLVIFLIVIGGAGGYYGPGLYKKYVTEPIAAQKAAIKKCEDNIAQYEPQLKQELLQKDMQSLAIFSRRSLPFNPTVAQSDYQTWLLELSAYAGFQEPAADAGAPIPQRASLYTYQGENEQGDALCPPSVHTLYYTMSFDVAAYGTLDDLSRFLFEFYNAAHLHRINSLTIAPINDQGEGMLQIRMLIETVMLPSAEQRPPIGARTDQLTRLPQWKRLASTRVDAYSLIGERNLLGVQEIRTRTDPASLAKITASTTSADGSKEIWINVSSEGATLRVGVGDVIGIGSINGRIVDIQEDDMILEMQGQRWLFELDDLLTEGFPLPPEF